MYRFILYPLNLVKFPHMISTKYVLFIIFLANWPCAFRIMLGDWTGTRADSIASHAEIQKLPFVAHRYEDILTGGSHWNHIPTRCHIHCVYL